MRTIRLAALIAAVALVGFGSPSLAGAEGAMAIPTDHLSANGGTIHWVVKVHNAKKCIWSSSPKVAGFNGTVNCKTGKVSRLAKFQSNTSSKQKDYKLTLTIRGETTTVDYLHIVEGVHVSIQMSIRDLTLPGDFLVHDVLRLTVNVYVGGRPANSGDVNLTTNDPQEPELCGILQPAGPSSNYCNIDFPNPGSFTITASYELVYNWPPHYTSTQTLPVKIQP